MEDPMDSIKRRKPDDDLTLGVLQQEELLVEILSKLPVKDAVQCRSVSKQWYAFAKSTYFTNKHFVNHCQDDDDRPSMMFLIDVREKIFKSETSICGISLLNYGKDEVISLKLPLVFRKRAFRNIRLLGCSNGLVLIRLVDQIVSLDSDQNVMWAFKLVMWNPTTKKHRTIPNPDSNLFLTYDINRYKPHAGFGFVHHDMIISTEYKLVRFFHHIINHDPHNTVDVVAIRALVFIQSTNSWGVAKHELETTSFLCAYSDTTVTLNSVVYYKICLQQQQSGLVSFDLRDEIFNLTEITTLDPEARHKWGDTPFYTWRNSLVTYYQYSDNNLPIWTLICPSSSDNTVWTPLLRLDPLSSDIPKLRKYAVGVWKDEFMISLVVKSDPGFYEDSSKYVCFRKQLVSCDIKTRAIRNDILKSEERIYEGILNYTRTLASV